MSYENLIARQEDIRIRAAELRALDEMDFTDEINEELEALKADNERVKKMLGIYSNLDDLAAAPDRGSATARTTTAMIPGSQTSLAAQDRRFGFSSLGDFCQAIAKSEISKQVDPRLLAPAYLQQAQAERSGQEGGYLVPPEYSPDVTIIHEGEGSLLALTDNLPTSSNVVELPVDEDTPHDFSQGVRAYWTAELEQGTKTRANPRKRIFGLDDLIALVDASNNVLDDAMQLDGLLRTKMPQAIVARLNQALMRGTGVGQPLGILNAPCRIEVPRETGQGASTFIFENSAKMFSRLDDSMITRNVRWMINSQVLPQLMGMTVNVKNQAGTDNVGGSAVYVPGGNVAGAPFGTLHGIPVTPSQWAYPLGTVGDISLVAWGGVLSRTKTGATSPEGAPIEISTHILFDRNASQYRVVFRVYAAPWYSKPLPPADPGGDSKSIIITLGAPP